jgi:hypothetical protein
LENEIQAAWFDKLTIRAIDELTMNAHLEPVEGCVPRHLLKPMSQRMKQVFADRALEAVLAAARRPPSNEDSLADGSSLGGLRRSFVTVLRR